MQPLAWRRLRSSEVLGFSLNELLLILLFGLLIVVQIFSAELGNARDQLVDSSTIKDQASALKREAVTLNKVLTGREASPHENDLPSDLSAALSAVDSISSDLSTEASSVRGKMTLAQIWTELRRLRIQEERSAEALSTAQADNERLLSDLDDRQNKLSVLQGILREFDETSSKATIEGLARERERRLAAEQELSIANGRLANAEAQRTVSEELSDQVQNLRNRIAALRRRDGTGFGPPPCWATPEGAVEFTYDITIRDGALFLSPGWPSHRESEWLAIEPPTVGSGRSFTHPDFRNSFAPIFRRSLEDDCRFFVRLFDSSTNKDAYKTGRHLVEAFFFVSVRD